MTLFGAVDVVAAPGAVDVGAAAVADALAVADPLADDDAAGAS